MPYLLSSPYLLVFGDDRIRGICEQMMLMQVVSVMLRLGARDNLGFFIYVCIALVLR